MKIAITLLLSIAFGFTGFAQNTISKEVRIENYLNKSQVRKKTGQIFLVTGAALFITGGIIDYVKRPELLAGFTYEFFGVSSALLSIPFFVSASSNKRKASLITLNVQNTMPVHHDVVLKFIQPAITCKISL